MAVDILLDDSGDIDLTNSTMTLTPDIQTSSRQQCLIDLKTYRGEWIFNINAGVPYLANDNNPIQLLGKSPQSLVDFYIRASILGRENITEILSYTSELDRSTRKSTISFKALTNSGEVVSVVDATIA